MQSSTQAFVQDLPLLYSEAVFPVGFSHKCAIPCSQLWGTVNRITTKNDGPTRDGRPRQERRNDPEDSACEFDDLPIQAWRSVTCTWKTGITHKESKRHTRTRTHVDNALILYSLLQPLTALFFLLPLVAVVVQAQEPGCVPFKEIYTDGTDLCETMWADSFKVVDDSVGSSSSSEPAYTMWFFDQENNPNDDVTRALFGDTTDTVPDQCHLQYFHKATPGPEDEQMTECHPWKNNACVLIATARSSSTRPTVRATSGIGAGP
jgi:hypothetical protein